MGRFGRLGLIACLAAAAAPLGGAAEEFEAACADPSIGCREVLSVECLRLGAGSIAATPGALDCETQMARYSNCLAYVAAQCPAGGPQVGGGGAVAAEPPPGHRVVAEGQAGGHRQLYVLAGGPIGWAEAAQSAERMGGRLLVIDSAAKSDAVFGVLVTHPELFRPAPAFLLGAFSVGPFIGLYQKPGSLEPAGGWRWVDGTPLGFARWLALQPDNWLGGEHVANVMCLNRETCDTWNDIKPEAGEVQSYIVEIPAP